MDKQLCKSCSGNGCLIDKSFNLSACKFCDANGFIYVINQEGVDDGLSECVSNIDRSGCVVNSDCVNSVEIPIETKVLKKRGRKPKLKQL